MQTSPQQPTSAEAAARLVVRTNAERTQRGLPALQVRADVASIAAGWSDTMARAARLSHNDDYFTDESHRRLDAQLVGENVARAPDVDTAHKALMASEHHRNNILDARFTVVGIGATYLDGSWWITEDFLQPEAVRAQSTVTTGQRAPRPPAGRVGSTSSSTSTMTAPPVVHGVVVAAVAAPALPAAVLPRVDRDRPVVTGFVGAESVSASHHVSWTVGAALLAVLMIAVTDQLRRRARAHAVAAAVATATASH